jgi:hypothetical protein
MLYEMFNFFFFSNFRFVSLINCLLFAIGVVIATSAHVIAPFADATSLSQGSQALLVSFADNAKRVLPFNLCHFIPIGDAGHGAVHVDDERAEGVQLDGCA